MLKHRLGHAVTVDECAIGALEVAEAAAGGAAFQRKVLARHPLVFGEADIGPIGPAHGEGLRRLQPDSPLPARSGNHFQGNAHGSGPTGVNRCSVARRRVRSPRRAVPAALDRSPPGGKAAAARSVERNARRPVGDLDLLGKTSSGRVAGGHGEGLHFAPVEVGVVEITTGRRGPLQARADEIGVAEIAISQRRIAKVGELKDRLIGRDLRKHGAGQRGPLEVRRGHFRGGEVGVREIGEPSGGAE